MDVCEYVCARVRVSHCDGYRLFSLSCRITREHRENLAKLAKQLSNKAKDSLRRARSNSVAQVKKAKEGHSEDTIRLVEKQVRVPLHGDS